MAFDFAGRAGRDVTPGMKKQIEDFGDEAATAADKLEKLQKQNRN